MRRFRPVLALLPPLFVARDGVVQSEASDHRYPLVRRSEVAEHKTLERGVWVIHKDGVYDVTKFVPNHPGGKDKIMLAAGDSIDPFWRLYKQHYNSKLPEEILLPLRIGTLHPDDLRVLEANADTSDPYSGDPPVSPLLKLHSDKPVNAECASSLLADSWITPDELFFVRNHHPVPSLSADLHTVTIGGLGFGEGKPLTIDDIKQRYEKTEVVSTLQCGGNRRQGMNEVDKTLGSPWSVAAIGTARWGGARLSEVIRDMLRDDPDTLRTLERSDLHLHMRSADGMVASVPLEKALNPSEIASKPIIA